MPDSRRLRRPLCFVLMPFGRKADPASGRTLDFDGIYEDVLRPAIVDADLEPLRADEEHAGGVIQKPMFERLILCDYAVADLTTANANVFYELGIRHALKPRSTVLVFADGTRLPFDVHPVRGLPYRVDAAGRPSDAAADRDALAERLVAARQPGTDSPVFQLVDDLPAPDVDHMKTDVFRDRVEYSREVRDRLSEARRVGAEAVRRVGADLPPLRDVDAGIVIDLMLSYRAVEAWDDMIALMDAMADPLAHTVMVREQYAFALNRAGDGEKAERVLLDLVEDHGPSSETYGILGRVYKDRWEEAREASRSALAEGLLTKAVDAYVKGFEADWRDPYPGVNAVTLMEVRQPPDPRQAELLPVVTYAVRRRCASGTPDYWDHATLLELAVLARDEVEAGRALGNALAAVREVWEPRTTLRNLRLIRGAREERGEDTAWMTDLEEALEAAEPA